jgi:cyclohexadieny/prephenate dehydrogenase
MKSWNRVAIVGVGLIGGSIGLALVRRGLAGHVVGIGRRPAALEAAERLGAVQSTSTDLASGVAGAELVVVCTPVGAIVERVVAAAERSAPGTLITDAGSTKVEIVAQIESQLHDGRTWRNNVRFLGGHPIAGNDKKGARHARVDLFEGRVCVLTPTANTAAEDRLALAEMWTGLGSRVVEMRPDEHDRALAAISHLPHVAAAAVAAATPRELVGLSAGGWLDTTRVAAGDPELWQQILLSNAENVVAAIDHLNERLAALRGAIEGRDPRGLEQLLAEAKQVRDAVGS